MNNESEPVPVIESWDTYWQGAQASPAYTDGGSSHPLVLNFWDDYFRDVRQRPVDAPIIDIASGSGAVVESAYAAFDGKLPGFTCLDVSDSAIRILEERYPGVSGVVADAASVPLDSGSFAIATSQFGIEYAGPGAVSEIIRLLARGGELVFLLHHRDGVIYRQCDASLDALRQMQSANFLTLCRGMFEAGFAALRGGDRDAYGAAGKRFAPAIRTMESIMTQHGRDVADGTIMRIYRDVRTIHDRMDRYAPADVIGWLDTMRGEIDAYAGRMASMRSVALDDEAFQALRSQLVDNGFDVLRDAPLIEAGQASPMAWSLQARKR